MAHSNIVRARDDAPAPAASKQVMATASCHQPDRRRSKQRLHGAKLYEYLPPRWPEWQQNLRRGSSGPCTAPPACPRPRSGCPTGSCRACTFQRRWFACQVLKGGRVIPLWPMDRRVETKSRHARRGGGLTFRQASLQPRDYKHSICAQCQGKVELDSASPQHRHH
jgi:hypothetical protein